MILQVPFEQFASTVKRVIKLDEVFVTSRGNATLATAASTDRQTMIVSIMPQSVAESRLALEGDGLKVFDGSWHTEGLLDTESENVTPYVAAVAYVSQENAPGLWVDAYESLPTQVTVLRALYDEFRETGQVNEVSFEEFVKMAQPTVVIATPDELHSFVNQKGC